MNHPRRLLIDLSYACNLRCTTCRCPDIDVTVSRANLRAFAGLVDHAAQIGPSVSVSVTHFSRLDANVTQAMEALLERPADATRNHWRLPRALLLTAEDLPVLRTSVAQMKQLADARGVRLRVDPALDATFDPAAIVEGTFALRKQCPVFETTLIVGPNGAIGSCPMLTHVSFGHVPAQSVAAIWDGQTFHHLRRRLRDGYLPVCSFCCRHGDLM